MNKKSTLAGIADEIQAEIASGALAPEPKSDVLASRGQSMRQFSDDLVYESYERIDPALCRPSAQNARQYGSLTYDDCADLIETIKSEGRQIMPAVVRHTGDPETPYEIVTGSRRHWAITWLRGNSLPNIKYLVDIQTLDDEAAFRQSDLENRARKDVTDLERAKSYANALDEHYKGDVSMMAERIGINYRALYRYLDLAGLDPVLIDAIGGPRVVTVGHARLLKPMLGKNGGSLDAAMELAGNIAADQRERAGEGRALVPAADVIKRLLSAKASTPRKAGQPRIYTDKSGAPLFSYQPPLRRAGLQLAIPAKFAGDLDELKRAISDLIDSTYSRP